jgi:hypothetical protein
MTTPQPLSRYRVVDRYTFQTVQLFASDPRTACLLAHIPTWRSTVYEWQWRLGTQCWVKITGKPDTGEQESKDG